MSIDVRRPVAVLSVALLAACTQKSANGTEHASHDTAAAASAGAKLPSDTTLPPGAEDAGARLAASPRHGEWVMIPAGTSPADSVRAWVVYPERSTKAPVIIVVHEIFGLSTWVRAVTDQLAAEGYIAIAPDLLTGKHIPMAGDSMNVDSAVAAIRTLDPTEVQRRLTAAAKYGMALPAALPRYGIVGFCWGGSISFAHAVASPSLGASVVYYGTPPKPDDMPKIHAPVLGLYGQNDARVSSTVPATDSVLHALGRTYEHFIFPGAGHGFLRAQSGQGGANRAAAEQAWPKTVAWFRKYLGA